MSHGLPNSNFLPHEAVQVCLFAQSNSAAGETVLEGTIAACGLKTLRILLNVAPSSPEIFSSSTRYRIRKYTSRGVLEFDASGLIERSADNAPMLTATIAGKPRELQRRGSFRFVVASSARYRTAEDGDGSCWRPAELHDVSLGGASLLLPAGALHVGQRIFLEFVLDDQGFSVSALVRRIENPHRGRLRLHALEYQGINTRLQNRMSKAIARLQQKRIRARLNVD